MLSGELMSVRCPVCDRPYGGQRFGLRFGELAVRIIDAVKHAGPDGIGYDDLYEMIYVDRPSQRSALKGYIEHINRRLSEKNDMRISGRGGRYHFAKGAKQ